ncbi:DUF885 domain-containing protein [Mycetocola reblochoni]|uniref:Conserved protein, DUF885 n=2 Tax=Mycetocola reblochoni TaxID=331618 RepID=A0A1R4J4N1_9MICO|nr:DUF885 domain-containing protein [Mycetocola reblochoni]RLP69537.1 DUF885 domain-containing protein [Mycetocola reblochoni]SJN26992.1 Conserved protein, DUF885 [Mycetocola reblochoni REB411]
MPAQDVDASDSHNAEPGERSWTEIDRFAERWVDVEIELDPLVGSYLGDRRSDGRLGDFSPEGLDAAAERLSRARTELDRLRPQDACDEVTRADLGSGLRLRLAAHDAGLDAGDLNVIESPPQRIRDAFDLMPRDGEDDWARIAERAAAVPDALTGYLRSLHRAADGGSAPAARQVVEVAAQLESTADTDGGFALLADAAEGAALPDTLLSAVTEALTGARAAYAGLAARLRDEYLPRARREDGVGRDVYALRSEEFLGQRIDLDECYEWGLAELDRMVSEQNATADRILPGAGVDEAIAFLETQERYVITGTDALQRWMQHTSDDALARLSGTQFSIPQPLHDLRCRIATAQDGGIYYTGPSDDFSRPGTMWWSVPPGVTRFDSWREKTTVYHEGIPGHHLQIGQAVVNRGQLNRWRRQLAGTSGHIEGWALYAERLMDELGFLDDPADRLGMLDGQRLRAARVVLDIGVHLGKQRPDGGGVWTAEYAHDFLSRNVNMNDGFVRFELNRYLGWPGQAPSYKVGQRIWESLRADRQRRDGDDFDVAAFHAEALALGGLRLDTLEKALGSSGP